MMKRGMIGLLILLMVTFAEAEEPSVYALLTSSNFIAGLNIPLRLYGVPTSPLYRISAEPISGTIDASQCKILRDPYIPQNFLLRCLKAGTISVQFKMNSPTPLDPKAKQSILTYGPLTIHQLDGLLLPGDGGGGGIDSIVTEGKALFASHCNSCHSQAASKKGRTGEQVWAAIQGVSSMRGLQGVVNRSDSDKIAAYLQSL